MTRIKKICEKITKGNTADFLEVLSNAQPTYVDTYKKKYRQMVMSIDRGDSLKDIYLSDNPMYVFDDCPDTMEIFVRLTEETYHIKVRGGKQLRDLTGLNSEPLDDMQNIYLSAMGFRLETALAIAIKVGLKYKELLEIDLTDFNLPEQWIDPSSNDFTNKMDVIKLSIAVTKGMGEHPSRRVSLQQIADDLDAPYDLIEEISKLYGG